MFVLKSGVYFRKFSGFFREGKYTIYLWRVDVDIQTVFQATRYGLETPACIIGSIPSTVPAIGWYGVSESVTQKKELFIESVAVLKM